MDEVVNRKPPAVRFSPKTWQPAIDIHETDSEVVALIERAGIREDEIEVTAQNGILVIRGERKDARQAIARTYPRAESTES